MLKRGGEERPERGRQQVWNDHENDLNVDIETAFVVMGLFF